jgi:hypothetical protein
MQPHDVNRDAPLSESYRSVIQIQFKHDIATEW